MRIAVDARELGGRPTGVGRYLRELLRAWAELPGAAGHEFVLCAAEPPAPAQVGALSVSTVTAPGSGTLWEQRVLPRLLRSSGADVLFAPAYTCPLLGPVPVVLTIHDVSFAAHPEWFSWREGLRRRILTRLAARRAARVITESDFSKREIVRHLGIDASRVEVIYLGVSSFRGHTDRERLVLHVGSLFNRRHIPELIDGFSRVAARLPDSRLVIVGDNRTTPHVDVESLVAGTGLGSQIEVRSYVTDEELAELYTSASVCAFLSDYEGFGLPPLEAMAAGVPVLVLDTDVAREIYGPAAFYLDRPAPDLIAGAIERLLVDREERARLLGAGTAQVERYSWRECALRTLQVLLTAS
jgi:glycosyltransferase involved in cell wall biosynthesis